MKKEYILVLSAFAFVCFLFVMGGPKDTNPSNNIPRVNADSIKAMNDSIAAREAAERERLNTGIWRTAKFVDDFGDFTDKRYLTFKNRILGSFSNTAVQNRTLHVLFIIQDSTEIAYKLFEYGGTNPVKGYHRGGEIYPVRVKKPDGEVVGLSSTLYNDADRLHFSKQSAIKLHKILKEGGKIQFSLYNSNRSTSKYNFVISDAKHYWKAYKQI